MTSHDFNPDAKATNVRQDLRFAYQIMGDLLARALTHGTRILGLFVDEENARAIKFYEHIGFTALPTGGRKYRRMFVYLHAADVR